jgi:ATP-dependent protease HslVU (ClpYQ) peptidase subunit
VAGSLRTALRIVYGSGDAVAYALEFLNVGCGFEYEFSASGA